jgi:hypothetical protein
MLPQHSCAAVGAFSEVEPVKAGAVGFYPTTQSAIAPIVCVDAMSRLLVAYDCSYQSG